MKKISLHILEDPQSLHAVEDLQRQVWTGSETEVIPSHLLLASVHNGGLLIGAFDMGEQTDPANDAPPDDLPDRGETPGPEDAPLVGIVFSFPGTYPTPDGPRLKHHSHILAVLPEYRDQGIGYLLKRAQWQMVRHQNLDCITWTYDPLLSRNAHLNISRLGAVCNTYFPEYYGEMRDGLNTGVASDRFQVDWWVNSRRVFLRLSKQPRLKLDLAHFLAADTRIINPTQIGPDGLPRPARAPIEIAITEPGEQTLLLLEIPSDFMALKAADLGLAREWREHTRPLFQDLFARGYIVTDFIHLTGTYSRSFYALSQGDSTL